jgi:hypothetical protein
VCVPVQMHSLLLLLLLLLHVFLLQTFLGWNVMPPSVLASGDSLSEVAGGASPAGRYDQPWKRASGTLRKRRHDCLRSCRSDIRSRRGRRKSRSGEDELALTQDPDSGRRLATAVGERPSEADEHELSSAALYARQQRRVQWRAERRGRQAQLAKASGLTVSMEDGDTRPKNPQTEPKGEDGEDEQEEREEREAEEEEEEEGNDIGNDEEERFQGSARLYHWQLNALDRCTLRCVDPQCYERFFGEESPEAVLEAGEVDLREDRFRVCAQDRLPGRAG